MRYKGVVSTVDHHRFRPILDLRRLLMTPRYLLPFDSRRALHRFTDILIIGGGLAGLRAANAVEPNQSVLVVTKDGLKESSSNYACNRSPGFCGE